jgi:1,4-alpha-glucan branching enzyme
MGTKEMNEAPVLTGMGSLICESGVGFRVWAGAADKVEVMGDFDGWQGQPLTLEGDGVWYGFVPEAKVGQEYQYRLTHQDTVVTRLDPYARLLTHSAGNSVIYNPEAFDWEADERLPLDHRKLVIYEMHVGTFAGTFQQAIGKLPYLEALGITAIELMPVTDFPGEISWGYNPAHLFAVETNYGGPDGFKAFVKEAHRRGIAVILDVVYNHLGPDDLCLWDFDGSDPQGGGPYFYNDHRAHTPWGDTRPNYLQPMVRQMLRDNALMWIQEYHVDGIRTDGTVYIRRDKGASDGTTDLPEGWSLLQWINDELHAQEPRPITIAEDLQHDDWLSKPSQEGGAGFDAQWDPRLALPLREMLSSPEDSARSPGRLAELLLTAYNGDPFQAVRFTENHDETAHGRARIPSEIDPDDPTSFWARARSSLGAFVLLTTPGIPMLLQGQERLDDGHFSDDRPIDWTPQGRDRDILHLYRDLIWLRTGREPAAPGLHGHGVEVLSCDEEAGWLAYRRFHHGAEDFGALVVIQLRSHPAALTLENLPSGTWECRFASGPALHREEEEPGPRECQEGRLELQQPAYSLSVWTLSS